ncbi:hypothetical protein GP486_007184, partial [Trichoglossum hirsutum]
GLTFLALYRSAIQLIPLVASLDGQPAARAVPAVRPVEVTAGEIARGEVLVGVEGDGGDAAAVEGRAVSDAHGIHPRDGALGRGEVVLLDGPSLGGEGQEDEGGGDDGEDKGEEGEEKQGGSHGV